MALKPRSHHVFKIKIKFFGYLYFYSNIFQKLAFLSTQLSRARWTIPDEFRMILIGPSQAAQKICKVSQSERPFRDFVVRQFGSYIVRVAAKFMWHVVLLRLGSPATGRARGEAGHHVPYSRGGHFQYNSDIPIAIGLRKSYRNIWLT